MGVIWCNPGKGPINVTQVFQGFFHSLEAHSGTVSHSMSWLSTGQYHTADRPYSSTVPHKSTTFW